MWFPNTAINAWYFLVDHPALESELLPFRYSYHLKAHEQAKLPSCDVMCEKKSSYPGKTFGSTHNNYFINAIAVHFS